MSAQVDAAIASLPKGCSLRGIKCALYAKFGLDNGRNPLNTNFPYMVRYALERSENMRNCRRIFMISKYTPLVMFYDALSELCQKIEEELYSVNPLLVMDQNFNDTHFREIRGKFSGLMNSATGTWGFVNAEESVELYSRAIETVMRFAEDYPQNMRCVEIRDLRPFIVTRNERCRTNAIARYGYC